MLIAIPAVAGFDVGKFHWSTLDVWSVIPGLVLLAVSTIPLNWARAVNPHFEPIITPMMGFAMVFEKVPQAYLHMKTWPTEPFNATVAYSYP